MKKIKWSECKAFKQMSAIILTLLLTCALTIPALAFTDTETHWAKEALDNWSDKGIINGYPDSTFKPDSAITRAEMAVVICNLMSYTEIANNSYSDVQEGAWYTDQILKNVAAGVIIGYENGLMGVNDDLTRQDAAVMLCRALNIDKSSSDTSFTDNDRIADYAEGYVASLSELGMINGYPSGAFEPEFRITRAETLSIINKAVSLYITESGTYTGEYNGIVLVKAENVVLDNVVINGNLIVSDIVAGTTDLNSSTIYGKAYGSFIGNYTVTVNPNPLSTTTSGSYYDLDLQNSIQTEIDTLKESNSYTIERPLAIWNPYGTITNGLYLYFETDSQYQISYVVEADGYSDYSNTLNNNIKSDNVFASEHEYMLIGLVPGVENTVTLKQVSQDGSQIKSFKFSVNAPELRSEYQGEIAKTSGESSEQLSNGLFAVLGTNSYAGSTFFFDNEGVIRGEIVSDNYRADNIIEYEDTLVFASSSTTLSRISQLGKIVNHYSIAGFQMHHDFDISSDGTAVILATQSGKDTLEDVIIQLNLETGEYGLLIDMGDVLPDYKNITNVTPNVGWDWMHFNSIELVNDNQVILSSRETSTIIKLSDIYGSVAIDYLIGEKDIWINTPYASKSLDKVGTFLDTGGQHSVRYVYDNTLPQGQYYIYLYNNNYWWYESKTDYTGNIPAEGSNSQVAANSMYYKYLVDENLGTYELVNEIKVPYSSVVSSAQDFGGHYVIHSGTEKIVGEYDSAGKLIAQFEYDTITAWGYRVHKNTYEGFWFA